MAISPCFGSMSGLQEKVHKEHNRRRSFSSFWRHGFKKAFKKSWDKYGQILIACGLLYTIGAVCLSKYANAKLWGIDMSLLVQLVIPSTFLVGFLVYHFLRAPYEIYLEQFEAGRIAEERLEAKLQSFYDKMTLLKIDLVKELDRSGMVRRYYCRVKIHNSNKTVAAENVEVRLTAIEAIPRTAQNSNRPLPNKFPIWLKPVEGSGKVVNPDSSILFELFTMERYSNLPVVKFIGKETEYSPYEPPHRWEGDVPKYQDCLIRIEVSALACSPVAERFWIKFSAAKPPSEIASFDYEKLEKEQAWSV